MDSHTFTQLSHDDQIAGLELLGRRALVDFGVEPVELTPLVHMENTTFKVVSPQGSFNLRISRPGYQSRSNLASEIQFLNALIGAGFPVPEPYQARVVRAQVPEVPEPRDCVLLRWMEGDFPREWSREQAYRVGQLMARLHQFTAEWEEPSGFDRGHLHDWAFEAAALEGGSTLTEEDLNRLHRADEYTRKLLTSLPRTPDRYGLIHADLHSGNVLFEGDDVRIIDFDDTHYAFLYYDFASCLTYQRSHAGYEAMKEGLLAGYADVRPLPPDTPELIDPFLVVRLTGLAKWVLKRSDNPDLRENGPKFLSWIFKQLRELGQ